MKIKLLKVLTTVLLTVISANTYCSDIKQNTDIVYCKDSGNSNIVRWDGTVQSMKSCTESIKFLFNYSIGYINEPYDEKTFNNHMNNFCEFLAINFENLLLKGEGFELGAINTILSKIQEDNNKDMFIEILKDKLLTKWMNMVKQNQLESHGDMVNLFINLLFNKK